MTYVYEYAEDNPHQHCHKIEVTTGEDLRLGRRAYIDQRCEDCRADVSEIDHLRALITAWADACILMERTGSLDTTTPEGIAAGQALIALRKAVGR